jgi:ZIP family zinc transporter
VNVLEWVIVITAIAGVGGTGFGGVVALFLKRDSSRVVSLLLSFAGGIMIGVVCFDMIQNSICPKNALLPTNIFLVIFFILVGYIVIWLLNIWIDKETNHEIAHIDAHHPKTADDLDELIHSDHYVRHEQYSECGGPASMSQLILAGIVMASAIALHNVPEGMVIGAAYAGHSNAGIFSGSGIIMACIIGLHNIPEGMAVAVPLISGGTEKSKALVITALSGAPTILGAILGYCLGTMSSLWLSFSLGFAAGAMFYVVFGELLPEAILMWRSKLPSLATVLGILVGLLLIYI